MYRILCIVASMNAGGAETFLMKIYREIDRSKYQMDFAVAVTEEAKYDAEIQELGGNIYHITPKTKDAFKNFSDIYKLVKKHHYKSVLRLSQHALSSMELLAAKMAGAQICAYRSCNSRLPSGSSKSLLLHRVFRFMPRYFANVRFAPSTEAAEFVFGEKCVDKGSAVILHNGIDLNVFCYDEDARKHVRKSLGIKEKQVVIGHIGRFSHQKNHDFLIDTFAEVKKQQPDAILMLVGNGELESAIRTKVEQKDLRDSVIFTGVRSDIPQLLSAMDILVFPSFYEGMPNVVIEAQATGLPCVISDSITKEVAITDLVSFVSLEKSQEDWGLIINEIINKKVERFSGTQSLRTCGYDISEVADKFIRLLVR